MKFRATHERLFAAVVVGLLLVLAGAASADAATVRKSVERYQRSSPFKCAPTSDQFVLDAFRTTNNCYGIATKSGPGWVGSGWPGCVNNNYYYITSKYMNGTERGTFSPKLNKAGWYEVWVSFRASSNRSKTTPFYVFTDSADDYKILVNEYAAPGAGGAKWAKLGTFRFEQHDASRTPTSGYVQVRNEAGHSESVDSASFKYVGPTSIDGFAATDGDFEDPPGTVITDRVRLTWTAATRVSKYQIYRDTVETFDPATASLLDEPTATTFDDTTAEANTLYYYFIRAVGVTGKLSDVASDSGFRGVLP